MQRKAVRKHFTPEDVRLEDIGLDAAIHADVLIEIVGDRLLRGVVCHSLSSSP